MDPLLVQRKLIQTLEALLSCQNIFEAYGWELKLPTLFIWMHPHARPEKRFLLRISFEGFPEEAPSYVYVNPDTKQPDDQTCPPISAYKPNWPGFCLNGTKEFYNLGHSERKPDWSPEKHPIASVLQEIQVELNKWA